VREVRPALQVQSVCLVEPVPRDHRDPPERKEHLARKGLKAQPVVTVSKVLSVCLALPDPRGPLERTVTRERLESPVRREARLTKENRVLPVRLVCKVLLVHRVLLEEMESPVPGVSRGCLGRRETRAPEVSPDHQVPSVCRVFLDPQARRERTVTLVLWVLPVHLAPEAPRVPAEPTAHKDLPVAWAVWDLWARRESKVRPATLDHLESPEPEDLKAREETREKLDRPVRLDPPAPKDPPETTVPRATLDPLASLEILAPLARPASLVLTEDLERRARMVNPVNLGLPVHQEKPDPQDHQAREDPREQLVQRADKERRAPRVSQVQRDRRAKPAQSDPRGLQGSPAQKVYAEYPDLLVNKDCLELQDRTAHLDPWVLPVSLA